MREPFGVCVMLQRQVLARFYSVAMTGNCIGFFTNSHAANDAFQGRKCDEKAYKTQNEVASVEISKR